MIKKSREAIVAQNDGIKPGKDIIQTKNTTLSVKQSGLAGKLERRLQDPWEKAAGGDIQESIEMLKAKDVTLAANGQDVAVIVSLTTNSALQNVETLLKNKGATVVRAGKDTIKIAVPIANLDDIASMPEVRHVRAVHPPKPKNTTKTQGISLTRANAWHSAGRTGQNVKVAIVDMGFAHLSTLKAQDEIPAGAIEVNYTATSMTDGFSSHGSACAETVYDMAPGAQQYLIKIDDPTDLITVKDYCIANGIKIISCSLGWDNLNFHDGIAYANPYTTVADHPITAVDLAQANDILWCAAAGNEQTQHTLIDWRDGGPAPDSTLDWNSSYSSYNRLELNNSFTIPAG
ncbi:MAG: hypothetical protein FJ220_05345, partial [Kiritimatiellaceae bacterium]|nr:hypothetical protein [Kiritimatiellaceae bacterium]